MLLTSPLAENIYNSIAELPILDYHTHLPAAEILDDHRFENLWELWLQHDHYKWRLMRACGVAERFITGDASPWEKFFHFATVLPLGLGNPVHQWAHMELASVFGITTQLNAQSAQGIWESANRQLAEKITVRTILSTFNVELVATTDDPFDDLAVHQALAHSDAGPALAVLPTFRPDRHLLTDSPDLTALKCRHDYFHEHGCRMSDHGLTHLPAPGTPAFDALAEIARWNHKKGWIMQLHLGAQRNVNSRMSSSLGPDSGFDTIGSRPQTEALITFLNTLDASGQLPKVILYNLNPNENAALCCALQNFQEAPVPGKLQYGPAWWHLDHVQGIREQLDTLTSHSALGTHIGMLTDSRSFTSYVRHDYYRRILASYLADKARDGTMPDDPSLLIETAGNIAYQNIRNYLPTATNPAKDAQATSS